ncbi:hypothetical protein PL373_01225 [Tenacibaculum maritimum]|nr:hypothetical protein [Tenacibaculum maritimum]MDB0599793.1 hypothetical protein [Tenacibaculum maritimum]MDB0610903.1 hypothetical protein [Tenacibaculum maritimum]
MGKAEGTVSKAQIQQWKSLPENSQGIHQCFTKDKQGNSHVTYVRKPTLHEIGAAAQFAETNPVKSGKIMFDLCRLGGSEIVPKNDEMKAGVMQYLGKLFKVAQAEGNEL